MTGREVFEMATLKRAEAIGREDLGVIEIGVKTDCIQSRLLWL